jgi:hypothetical protein
MKMEDLILSKLTFKVPFFFWQVQIPLCTPGRMYLTFVPSLGRISNGFGPILVADTVNDGRFEGRYFRKVMLKIFHVLYTMRGPDDAYIL